MVAIYVRIRTMEVLKKYYRIAMDFHMLLHILWLSLGLVHALDAYL